MGEERLFWQVFFWGLWAMWPTKIEEAWRFLNNIQVGCEIAGLDTTWRYEIVADLAQCASSPLSDGEIEAAKTAFEVARTVTEEVSMRGLDSWYAYRFLHSHIVSAAGEQSILARRAYDRIAHEMGSDKIMMKLEEWMSS